MPAKRAASARVRPSSAPAIACIRQAAARSGSRRASRRSSAADLSPRIASRLPFIVPAPSRSGSNGTRRLRVAPSHRRVSSDADRYYSSAVLLLSSLDDLAHLLLGSPARLALALGPFRE